MSKYPREVPLSRPIHIYKGPQRNRAVRNWTLLCADAPDAQVLTDLTLTSVRSPPCQPLDRSHVSLFKSRALIFNGQVQSTALVKIAPDAPVHSTYALCPINTISRCWVSCTGRSTVTHLTLSLLRLVWNKELRESSQTHLMHPLGTDRMRPASDQ
jgi:hypothetical protein